MIINNKNSSANFVRSRKYVVGKGFMAVFDKPYTKLSTETVNNSGKYLFQHGVMTPETGALAQS
jgi:hypothetical protein